MIAREPASSQGGVENSAEAGSAASDDDFLDDVLDEVTAALADGTSIDASPFIALRPHLRARIDELVRWASDVSVVAPASAPEISGFEIVRELGRGGMGTVYLARQASLGGRLVALKVLPHGVSLSERARTRFRKEAEGLARIRHPNVVQVFDVVELDGAYAFAMEWIDGRSLLEVVQFVSTRSAGRRAEAAGEFLGDFHPSQGWFDVLAGWGADVAAALQCTHDAGLLHRDVKPSNIMLRRDGGVLLADFGLVRDEDAPSQTVTGAFLGTVSYAAPEQLRGAVLDQRTDVYGLGATLFHAACGVVPYPAESSLEVLKRVEQGLYKSPRKVEPALPADLSTIIETAMDADPERRYRDAKDLHDDLRRFVERRPIRARPAGAITRLSKAARRNKSAVRGAVIGAVIVLAISIALAVHFVRQARLPGWIAESVQRARHNLLDPRFDEFLFSQKAPARLLLEHARKLGVLRRHKLALAHYDRALELGAGEDVRAERDTVLTALTILGNDRSDVGALEERAAVTARIAREWQHSQSFTVPEDVSLDGIAKRDRRCLGLLALLCGNPRLCIRAWRGMDLAEPPDQLVDAALGQLYWQNKQAALAWPRLERAFAHFKNAGFLCVRLADAALSCGDPAYALRMIKRAQSLGQHEMYNSVTRVHAECLLALGRRDEARKVFDQLAKQVVHPPTDHERLARFFESERRLDRVVHHRWRVAMRWPMREGAIEKLGEALEAYWQSKGGEARRAMLAKSLETPGSFLDKLLYWRQRRTNLPQPQSLERLSERVTGVGASLGQLREAPAADRDVVVRAWLSAEADASSAELEAVVARIKRQRTAFAERPPLAWRFESLCRQANGPSMTPALSSDGGVVAFASLASNLVEEDTNRVADVFIHDRRTRRTIRVSRRSGVEADDSSVRPTLSGDGTCVAFYSRASNLTARGLEAAWRCYVFDRERNRVELVGSATSSGLMEMPASSPCLSSDGRFVLFSIGGDSSAAFTPTSRLLLWDRQLGREQWRGPEDRRAFGVLSSDGRRVAFTSETVFVQPDTNAHLADAFRYDVASGQVACLSQIHGRRPKLSAHLVAASADCDWVAFRTVSTNMTTVDNPGRYNIFLRHAVSPTFLRVTQSSDGIGADANGLVGTATTGELTVFGSVASNLAESTGPAMIQLFVHETVTRRTTMLTRAADGRAANGPSRNPVISKDGRVIAFETDAKNLAPSASTGSAIVLAVRQ